VIALFFDTETTGFKHGDFIPEIVQIGAILQDTETRRVLGELNVIVSATKPIPPVVSEIHGITDELNGQFGVDGSIAESMFGLMVQMSDEIVAHNIAFDVGIIKDAWPVAHGLLLERQQYCTMLNGKDVIGIAKSHGGGNKFPKLIEAYRHFFGVDFDNAHDAMADVRACRDVYFELKDLEHGVYKPAAEPDTKTKVLELIEQSKDQLLPLAWLTKKVDEL
jgi:DNA polymerase III epsilon subunit-like protein